MASSIVLVNCPRPMSIARLLDSCYLIPSIRTTSNRRCSKGLSGSLQTLLLHIGKIGCCLADRRFSILLLSDAARLVDSRRLKGATSAFNRVQRSKPKDQLGSKHRRVIHCVAARENNAGVVGQCTDPMDDSRGSAASIQE
ncbi:hypothetical protein SPRG_13429 [Saprolegnia parasitica CBS 223.65]|uniref:Uncharacterized protein n=1 Tax=Saprolegnia parasitica (strain CBS 223.65) TaxID=695850 RepID=A0A067C1N7_SAPPC|nr:hypothetical protein SPRG_13429 [Saprolegnia parasitica CBS 223.65]KDO20677.1 hypothetical protein SPRG_13429 [Saprolegnia parasitica CBS 223.65]|eukprot:XP_012208642.1 hypothetical protein SPRG_13429 [Saprolegnia parasitica CBS 223.65]